MRLGISTACFYPQPVEEILPILAGLGAVSYTHLDVYKRQVYTRAELEAIAEVCCRRNVYVIAVSYTHLDVYKRQNVHGSLLPRWRGAAPIQWSVCLLYTSACRRCWRTPASTRRAS